MQGLKNVLSVYLHNKKLLEDMLQEMSKQTKKEDNQNVEDQKGDPRNATSLGCHRQPDRLAWEVRGF